MNEHKYFITNKTTNNRSMSRLFEAIMNRIFT